MISGSKLSWFCTASGVSAGLPPGCPIVAPAAATASRPGTGDGVDDEHQIPGDLAENDHIGPATDSVGSAIHAS